MSNSQDSTSMALFCDFENLALGVRDAQYDKFDIRPILERLLLKGSIVVKKAYCDWERYKGFKATMHEANFELIEIPHVRQSGKNSADIRLVVDALDLCYTKSHVDTFVILSGDSDFSPLVSKLRENAKKVIGVGVKQSTSDLLVANCDEFIFYDELVRESQREREQRDSQRGGGGRREVQGGAPAQPRRTPAEEQRRREELEQRRGKGIDIAVATFDALAAERGDSGKIWASVLKEAIKRRRPDFSESRYGFRAFGNLLEEARSRGLLEFGRDEKSGTFVYRSAARAEALAATAPAALPFPQGADDNPRLQADNGWTADAVQAQAEEAANRPAEHPAPEEPTPPRPETSRGRGRGRGSRRNDTSAAPAADRIPEPAPGLAPDSAAPRSEPAAPASEPTAAPEQEPAPRKRAAPRRPRKKPEAD